MGNKTVSLILVVFILILALVCIYNVSETPNDDSSLVGMDVYSGEFELSEIIEDIETGSYYEGYDHETVDWMKSLGDKAVFSGEGSLVIMDSDDAGKIKYEDATDVQIIGHIKCNVLENHSLGDVEYNRDVLLVDDVEYLGQSIEDLPGGGA